jgi:E3 ubiquitin-protein ligase SIAH1
MNSIPTSSSNNSTNSNSNVATTNPSTASNNNSAAAAADSSSLAMDLVSLFECPVCFDYALPPIMQCHSGHIVCSSCREKLTTCPTCRATLDNIRNLAMEKLALSVQFPCKYSSNGCTNVFYCNQKSEHEEICEHRPYACPCPGASCKWSGSLEQVMNHLLSQHKSITTLQGEDIVFLATDINLPGAIDWVTKVG